VAADDSSIVRATLWLQQKLSREARQDERLSVEQAGQQERARSKAQATANVSMELQTEQERSLRAAKVRETDD
jgi:hypothetical protein